LIVIDELSQQGASIRASAERAREVRKEADRLAWKAWNARMLGYKGPAQPVTSTGRRSERRLLLSRGPGYDTHQTVALDVVRRPKTTPIHEMERYIDARIARRFGAIPISAVILWRCDQRRSLPLIRHRHGGRASVNAKSG